MNFGQAFSALLNGKSITRTGWNGPEMKLGLQPPTGKLTQPCLYIERANGECSVFTPSQADLFATDWQAVGAQGQTQAEGADAGQREHAGIVG